jgi:hypothetical protein
MTRAMRDWVLLATLSGSGCGWTNTNLLPAPPPPPAVPAIRPADIESWTDAPRIELELHPLFSTLQRQVTPLVDGRELWDYPHCNGQVCCHNQFIVAGPAVQAYRVLGSCYTDCSVRPASHACPADQVAAEAEAVRARAQAQESQERWRRFGAEMARQQEEQDRKRVTTTCRPDYMGGVRCQSE